MCNVKLKNRHFKCIGLDLKISLPVMTGQRFKPKKNRGDSYYETQCTVRFYPY